MRGSEYFFTRPYLSSRRGMSGLGPTSRYDAQMVIVQVRRTGYNFLITLAVHNFRRLLELLSFLAPSLYLFFSVKRFINS